jgi:hypothetical protein
MSYIPRPYTPDEDAFIRKCIAEGTTSTYCALKINRQHGSVITRAARWDLHFINRRSGRKLLPCRYG